MKKRVFQVLALVLALTMCAAMAVSVLAEDGTFNDGTTYEANKTGKVNFDSDLILPKNATVPEVEFTYTLAKNENAGFVFGGWKILEGIFDLKDDADEEDETAPVDDEGAYSVEFDTQHPTTTGVEDNVILEDDTKKYATESFTIDFSMVDFPEAGIYRYIVTQDEGEEAGIQYNTTNKTFYVDVYVVNGTDGPTIADVVVSDEDTLTGAKPGDETTPDEGDDDNNTTTPGEGGEDGGDDTTTSDESSTEPKLPGSTPGDKYNAGGDESEEGEGEDKVPGDESSDDNTTTDGEGGGEDGDDTTSSEDESSDDGDDDNNVTDNEETNKGSSNADFVNEYTPLVLTLSKTVVGTTGSQTDSFKFTIQLENLDKNGVYYIISDHESVALYLVSDGDGKGTATVYLKHNEALTINVPYGTTYTITEAEDVADANEYITVVNPETGFDWEKATEDNDDKTASGALETTDTTVAFNNYMEGTLPTGILLAIAPFVILMVVAVVGGVIVLKKKKED